MAMIDNATPMKLERIMKPMRLDFWGTNEEFKQFKKKYPALAKCVNYAGDGIQHNREYAIVEKQIKKDIEDMKHIKYKLVHVMDKVINRVTSNKEKT